MQGVLVAGSTGYLGKYVTREFKRHGYWVRALARNPKKLEETGPFLEPAVRDQIDEVFVGEATRPETLTGLCKGVEVVFSSLGITRQKEKYSFTEVDYQANKNILELALASGVKKFIFVSVAGGKRLRNIDVIAARERLVDELRNSGLDYTIVRPTGYFSDMTEFLRMAVSGRVYLIGNGKFRINPIHGADLARVCIDAVKGSEKEIEAGGPETFTYEEVAELAFSVLGKEPKITHIPAPPYSLAVKLMYPFVSSRTYTISKFYATIAQMDCVTPPYGTHTLEDYFKEIAPAIRGGGP